MIPNLRYGKSLPNILYLVVHTRYQANLNDRSIIMFPPMNRIPHQAKYHGPSKHRNRPIHINRSDWDARWEVREHNRDNEEDHRIEVDEEAEFPKPPRTPVNRFTPQPLHDEKDNGYSVRDKQTGSGQRDNSVECYG